MRSGAGFSLLETLIVLGVLGFLMALIVAAHPSSAVVRDASALAQHLRMERWRQVLRGAGPTSACIDAAALERASAVVTWPSRGLAFDDQGVPRTCDGGGVGNATIVLEHRGMRAAVIVSNLGRVRWERR